MAPSKSTRRGVFAVYTDATDAAASTTVYKQQRKREAAHDKENERPSDSSAFALSTAHKTGKSSIFNGKVPFELASPAVKEKDRRAQKLGFYSQQPALNKLAERPTNNALSSPYEVLSTHCDPIKPVALSGTAKYSQRKPESCQLKLDRQQVPSWPETPARMSPALADVTQAYNGSGAFQYSPLREQSSLNDPSLGGDACSPLFEGTRSPFAPASQITHSADAASDLAAQLKDLVVLPCASPAESTATSQNDVLQHADDPTKQTVVLSGSPIKKRAAGVRRPLGEKRTGLSSLRL